MTQLKWNDVMVYILKKENKVLESEITSYYNREPFGNAIFQIIELLILKKYIERSCIYKRHDDKYLKSHYALSVTKEGLDALEGVDGFTWTSLY